MVAASTTDRIKAAWGSLFSRPLTWEVAYKLDHVAATKFVLEQRKAGCKDKEIAAALNTTKVALHNAVSKHRDEVEALSGGERETGEAEGKQVVVGDPGNNGITSDEEILTRLRAGDSGRKIATELKVGHTRIGTLRRTIKKELDQPPPPTAIVLDSRVNPDKRQTTYQEKAKGVWIQLAANLDKPTDTQTREILINEMWRHFEPEWGLQPNGDTPFSILGLADTVEPEVVKAAYHALVRKYHEAGTTPDANRMQWINRAHTWLIRRKRNEQSED